MIHMPALGQPPSSFGTAPVRVGLDLVDVRRMRESIERFGDRMMRRMFSAHEIEYAKSQDERVAEHLAARFAAKEAAIAERTRIAEALMTQQTNQQAVLETERINQERAERERSDKATAEDRARMRRY